MYCSYISKKEIESTIPKNTKEDYLKVTRYESCSSEWKYSGYSIDAVRFMCDTDVLLYGFGLYGSSGKYITRIKVFDIGVVGGYQEEDGEIVGESEELFYECAPKDIFPILLNTPVPIQANRWYVAWACINGPSSDCGSSGKGIVTNDDITFIFKSSKRSNNGTNVNAGQIPCLFYNTSHDKGAGPIVCLTKNLLKNITVDCFKSLITLLQWSWKELTESLFDTNGLVPINLRKLTLMNYQKKLVYVMKACLRLIKSYINNIFPNNRGAENEGAIDNTSYFTVVAEIKTITKSILSYPVPTCAMTRGRNRPQKVCHVKFALEMMNSIHEECSDVFTSCFHAFFPTPSLMWKHLRYLLKNIKVRILFSGLTNLFNTNNNSVDGGFKFKFFLKIKK